MTTIEKLSESLANQILEDRILNKDDLKIKLQALIKTMFDIKSVQAPVHFKKTTLDYVSYVANKNKFKSNFWLHKMEERVPKGEMKRLYIELREKMSEADFSGKREKKFNNIKNQTNKQ